MENRQNGLPRIAKLRSAKPAVAFLSIEQIESALTDITEIVCDLMAETPEPNYDDDSWDSSSRSDNVSRSIFDDVDY